jgi:hypothetical protein
MALKLSKVEWHKICKKISIEDTLNLRQTCKYLCRLISKLDLFWFEKYIEFKSRNYTPCKKSKENIYYKEHIRRRNMNCIVKFTRLWNPNPEIHEKLKEKYGDVWKKYLFESRQEMAIRYANRGYQHLGLERSIKYGAIRKMWNYLNGLTDFSVGEYCENPDHFDYKLKPIAEVAKNESFSKRDGHPIYWYLIEVYRSKRKKLANNVEATKEKIRRLENNLSNVRIWEQDLKESKKRLRIAESRTKNKVFYKKRAKIYKPIFKLE